MDGFHYTGDGGFVSKDKQVFAELILPPGMYMIFAKANIAVSSRDNDQPNITRAYEARVEMGNIDDSLIGGLRYDTDDPGSRYESINLNIAGEIADRTRVKLMFSRGLNTVDLIVSEPRLSAIRLESLEIATSLPPPEPQGFGGLSTVAFLGISRRTLLSLLVHDSTTEIK
jgi:hypothetical protein